MEDEQAELLALHEQLVCGDRVAPAKLAHRLLPAITARLEDLYAKTRGDPHVVGSAIGDSIARYLKDPDI